MVFLWGYRYGEDSKTKNYIQGVKPQNKMKTKTIKLYDYEELSDNAKSKALEDYNRDNDYPYLEDDLKELLIQLLEDNKIKAFEIPELYYSLSYSQGDGVCFCGVFTFKDKTFTVNSRGHYSHKKSVNIEIEDNEIYENDTLEQDTQELIYSEIEKEFKEIYENICDKIEKNGYSQIEYEESEENFKQICEMNEYTFRENGEMEN